MNQKEQAIVQTRNLTRTYQVRSREVHALQGVDLEIAPGRLVALRGRSGSGKTTLLNCIGGLDRPTTGQVWVDGHEMQRLAERTRVRLRRSRIGFVFQSYSLLPTYSAAENVDLMLRLAGMPMGERSRRVRQVLSMVGLERWADHRPYELSGGQQQRVAIARALATRPALILADEPTGELDSATGQAIWRLFRQIVETEGTTILIATHDLTVDMVADEVYLLQDGRIAEQSKIGV